MDSFPRFINSDIYLKHKGFSKSTGLTISESKLHKLEENEDFTYLLVRANDPAKGIKLLSRQKDGIFFPECL